MINKIDREENSCRMPTYTTYKGSFGRFWGFFCRSMIFSSSKR